MDQYFCLNQIWQFIHQSKALVKFSRTMFEVISDQKKPCWNTSFHMDLQVFRCWFQSFVSSNPSLIHHNLSPFPTIYMWVDSVLKNGQKRWKNRVHFHRAKTYDQLWRISSVSLKDGISGTIFAKIPPEYFLIFYNLTGAF